MVVGIKIDHKFGTSDEFDDNIILIGAYPYHFTRFGKLSSPTTEYEDSQKSKIHIILIYCVFIFFKSVCYLIFATNRHLNKAIVFQSFFLLLSVIQHSIRLCYMWHYFYSFVSLFKGLTLCDFSAVGYLTISNRPNRWKECVKKSGKKHREMNCFYFCLHLASIHFELLWSNWNFETKKLNAK